MGRPRRIGPLLLLTALASPAAAQSYWHDDHERLQVRLELLKPFLDNFPESFLTGAGILSGSARLASAFRLEADLPFTRFAAENASATAFRGGNPYLGLVYRPDTRGPSARLGVRLPLLTDPDDVVAFFADDVGRAGDFDRFEAFLPETFAVRGAFEWRWDQSDGTIVGIAAGSTLLVPTGDGEEDVDLFGDYGVRLGHRLSGLQAFVAFTGRIRATEEGLSFAERTQHNLRGSLELRQGRVRPGISVRVPVDPSVRDAVPAVLGLDLRLVL